MAKLKVGLDFDDVISDFHGSLCLFHNRCYYTSLKRADIDSYYLEKIWGCAREESTRRVVEFYKSPEHDNASPILGAIETVKALSSKVTFFVVTSRPESVRDQTCKWLEKYLPGLISDIYFTSHFFHTEKKVTKGEVCRQLGIDIFVDDAPIHIDEVMDEVEEVLLFDTPWNQYYQPERSNVKRVYSWNEIHNLLTK